MFGTDVHIAFRVNFKSMCPTQSSLGRTSSKRCSSQLVLKQNNYTGSIHCAPFQVTQRMMHTTNKSTIIQEYIPTYWFGKISKCVSHLLLQRTSYFNIIYITVKSVSERALYI